MNSSVDFRIIKKSRFYVTMLLLRRIIFVTLLITLSSISSRNLIGILIFFQFIYGIYIIFIRPFKEAKGNLIEILNEAYFSLFLVTLMIFNTQNEWNSFKINIYIWILASNSLFVFLIIFSKMKFYINIVCLIKTMIKWCKNKWQKNKVILIIYKYRIIKKSKTK